MIEHATNFIFYRGRYVPTELLSRLGVLMTSTLDLASLWQRADAGTRCWYARVIRRNRCTTTRACRR